MSELFSLQKKLASAWSAWCISRTLTLSLIEDVYNNFSKLEKKVKMRILLSLISLDVAKKNELSKSIKRLLKIACEEDEEKWVSITAGMVYDRLFRVSSVSIADPDGILTNANLALESNAEKSMERLIELSSSDTASEATFYFQPLEFRYISSSALTMGLGQGSLESTEHGGHFVYFGKTPDFMGREKDRQLVDQKARAGPTLMRVKADPVPLTQQQQQPLSSSSSSGSMGAAGPRRSSIASSVYKNSGGSTSLSRQPAKVLTLEELTQSKRPIPPIPLHGHRNGQSASTSTITMGGAGERGVGLVGGDKKDKDSEKTRDGDKTKIKEKASEGEGEGDTLDPHDARKGGGGQGSKRKSIGRH